jgi:diamine N-acetyltransferase
MTLTIRRALKQDFPVIFSLIKEFAEFQKTPDNVKITLEQMIA